ncbi:MAG: HlyC/CorC family transporter, partial [Simkania negevensis]|nr:HlyC/CorC family transporter [Simkania negevensis]
MTIPILALIGATLLTALVKALYVLGRIPVKKEFRKRPFFYSFFHLVERLFADKRWEILLYLLSFTKHLLRLIYAISFFSYLLFFFSTAFPLPLLQSTTFFILILGIALFFDFLPRLFVPYAPKTFFKIAAVGSTPFLFLFFPITFPLAKLQKIFLKKKQWGKGAFRAEVKEKILELAQESEFSEELGPLDRKLITSIASYRERIVREIMIPRINIFSLSVHQTVHDAAEKFISERYSRIPVYKDSLDTVVGILHYKDVMTYYYQSMETQNKALLETPLSKLIKPVIYTPETKKISHLLQEFRKMQIHLSIVVDEYGGTEGIVTIEDILEELVGEIGDEFDKLEEDKLYITFPGGGWIVNGKMSIIDIEKELGIEIPKSPEYDTIGGYVFHRAGTIPSKGWKIHHDNFDLEILASTDR